MCSGLILEAMIVPQESLDHKCINLFIEILDEAHIKPFKFEKLWLDHPNFMENIHSWWQGENIQIGSLIIVVQICQEKPITLEQGSLRKHLLREEKVRGTNSSNPTKLNNAWMNI